MCKAKGNPKAAQIQNFNLFSPDNFDYRSIIRSDDQAQTKEGRSVLYFIGQIKVRLPTNDAG